MNQDGLALQLLKKGFTEHRVGGKNVQGYRRFSRPDLGKGSAYANLDGSLGSNRSTAAALAGLGVAPSVSYTNTNSLWRGTALARLLARL